MAKKFKVKDPVFVPTQKIRPEYKSDYVIVESEVVASNKRSFKITMPNGEWSNWIGTALGHKKIGLCIFAIGDYGTESKLTEPLAKSLLQFCRLFYQYETDVVLRRIRSFAEFKHYWQKDIDPYRYVVFIGHGDRESILFGVDGEVHTDQFVSFFNDNPKEDKTLISLCCQTGYKSFAGKISECSSFSSVIAPFHSIHGVTASQFLQNYLSNHLLQGNTSRTAFKNSRENTIGSSTFRMWQRGELLEGIRS